MKIEFECSGGVGGLFVRRPLRWQGDTATLPESERDALVEHIRASGILDLDPAGSAPPPAGPARDVFRHRLVLRDGGAKRTFHFDDATAPPAVRPLLGFLQTRAMGASEADPR